MSLLLPFQFLFLMMSHTVTNINPPPKKKQFVLFCFSLFVCFFCVVFLGRHLFQHLSVTRLFEQRITHVEFSFLS